MFRGLIMIDVNKFLDLQNKVAIVTGAATGLGAASAQILAAAGANVLINHMPGQERVAESVAKGCANDTLCCVADITNDEECHRMVQVALEKWGRVDILINNAGINKPVDHHDLDGLSATDFSNFNNVHVIGSYQMIRAVSPAMKIHGQGVVVNVSSGSGEDGYGSSVAYSASKGAMNTMTKSLGRSLAPEIRVNAICPGFMNTPLWDKLNLSDGERQEQQKQFIAFTPLQTEPTAEIVARSILFLASDLSEHLAGQLLTSDGGMALGVYKSMFD